MEELLSKKDAYTKMRDVQKQIENAGHKAFQAAVEPYKAIRDHIVEWIKRQSTEDINQAINSGEAGYVRTYSFKKSMKKVPRKDREKVCEKIMYDMYDFYEEKGYYDSSKPDYVYPDGPFASKIYNQDAHIFIMPNNKALAIRVRWGDFNWSRWHAFYTEFF